MSKGSFNKNQKYNNKGKKFAQQRANGVGISRTNQSVIGGSAEFRQKQIDRTVHQLSPEQRLAWEILSHVNSLSDTFENGFCSFSVAFIPNENRRGEQFEEWMDEVRSSMAVKSFSYKTEKEAFFIGHNEQAILFIFNPRTWWDKEATHSREGFNLCMVLPFPFAPREDGVTYSLKQPLPKTLTDSVADTLELIQDVIDYNEGVNFEIELDGASSIEDEENFPSWAMGSERTKKLLFESRQKRHDHTAQQRPPKDFKGKQPKKQKEQVQEKNTVLTPEMAAKVQTVAAATAQQLAD